MDWPIGQPIGRSRPSGCTENLSVIADNSHYFFNLHRRWPPGPELVSIPQQATPEVSPQMLVEEFDPFRQTQLRSVSIEQAGQILRVSRRTIYYWIRDGRLQTVRTRLGSQRILMDSIRACWLQKY
jgi:excisionase family DNA binding protein